MKEKNTIVEHLLRHFRQSKKFDENQILKCFPKKLRKSKAVKQAFQELLNEKIIIRRRVKKSVVYQLNSKKARELKEML